MSATATGPVVCAACGTTAPTGARFCEECGADLPLAAAPAPPATTQAPSSATPRPGSAPTVPTVALRGGAGGRSRRSASRRGPTTPTPTACLECGGEVDADGYCTQCGTKAPLPRDHMVEQPQAWVASVSDKGRRHHRNEDAAAVDADASPGTWAALVVCDGVSSSRASDTASLAAARAARDVLVRERGAGLAQGSALTALAEKRLVAAGAAAARAVEEVTHADHGDNPPSCTFVAAVLDGDRLAVGNVGDSRAYWLPDAGEPAVLTTDDSWAAEQIAEGVPQADAEAGPQAHAITRWLGVDAHDQVPRVTHRTLDGPGWLLLCSDGLWNYCSEPTSTARVVADAAAAHDGEPLATAQALVRWANAQGGKDNITVALARLGARTVATARTHEGDPA